MLQPIKRAEKRQIKIQLNGKGHRRPKKDWCQGLTAKNRGQKSTKENM